MQRLTDHAARFAAWVLVPQRRDERGDVPGWVMITVMTVAIVGVIWTIADQELTSMLRSALTSVGKG